MQCLECSGITHARRVPYSEQTNSRIRYVPRRRPRDDRLHRLTIRRTNVSLPIELQHPAGRSRPIALARFYSRVAKATHAAGAISSSPRIFARVYGRVCCRKFAIDRRPFPIRQKPLYTACVECAPIISRRNSSFLAKLLRRTVWPCAEENSFFPSDPG